MIWKSPLKQKAIDGITPAFNSLLRAGVIVPCKDSLVRTFFCWRIVLIKHNLMIWDSSKICKLSTLQYNNALRLFQILKHFLSKFWRIVNCSLLLIWQRHFFSIQIDKDSLYWFVFESNRNSYTFTCLRQGYCESPTIYNQALKESLRSLDITPGRALWRFNDLWSNKRILWKLFCSSTKISKCRRT